MVCFLVLDHLNIRARLIARIFQFVVEHLVLNPAVLLVHCVNQRVNGQVLGVFAGPAVVVVVLDELRRVNSGWHLVLDEVLVVRAIGDEVAELCPVGKLAVHTVNLVTCNHILLCLLATPLDVVHIGWYELQRARAFVGAIANGLGAIEVGPCQEYVGLSVLPIEAGGLGIVTINIYVVGGQEGITPIQGVALILLHLQPRGNVRTALCVELVATRGCDIVHATDKAIVLGHIVSGSWRFVQSTTCAAVDLVGRGASCEANHLALLLSVTARENTLHAHIVGTREEQ